MIRSLALFGLAAGLASVGAAQTTLHYREGQRVEPTEVRRILEQRDATTYRTRSIRLLPDASADEAAAPPPVASDAPSALSLPVQFEFDSATILPSAREQLDALAEGIRLLPRERSVVIEGHTDAAGSDEYNHALSRRRALAVKHYLVTTHRIDPTRLREAGYGESRPIEGADRYAPENRRVQFRGG